MKKYSFTFVITGYLVGIFLLFGCNSPDEKANRLFTEASQLMKSAQDAEQTSYTNALKYYRAALADVEKIISKYPSAQLAVKIKQNELKMGSYSYSIDTLKGTIINETKERADAEKSPLACAFFMTRKAKKDPLAEAKILIAISDKYAKDGKKAKAYEILSQVLQIAKEKGINSIIAEVGDRYEQDGQKEKVNQLLQLMQQIGVDSSFLRLWVSLNSNRYGTDETLQLAKEVKDDYHRAVLVAAIADKCSVEGQKDKASEIRSQALQIAEAIRDDRKKTEALIEITGSYAEAGQYDQAFQLAGSIKDADSKDAALVKIVRGYAKFKQYDQAFQVAGSITSTHYSPKGRALLEVATKYAEERQYDQALQVAKSIKRYGYSELALIRIIGSYARAGQYDQAFQLYRSIEESPHRVEALAEIVTEFLKVEQKADAMAKISHELIRQTSGILWVYIIG